jgi:hypothetical protein
MYNYFSEGRAARKQEDQMNKQKRTFDAPKGSDTTSKYKDGTKKIILAQPLSSNGVSRYKIILGRDNVVYCTCVSWAFRKSCRHLTEYVQSRRPKAA